jgi:hypothetical protein
MAFRQPGNATQLFPGKGNFNLSLAATMELWLALRCDL